MISPTTETLGEGERERDLHAHSHVSRGGGRETKRSRQWWIGSTCYGRREGKERARESLPVQEWANLSKKTLFFTVARFISIDCGLKQLSILSIDSPLLTKPYFLLISNLAKVDENIKSCLSPQSMLLDPAMTFHRDEDDQSIVPWPPWRRSITPATQ